MSTQKKDTKIAVEVNIFGETLVIMGESSIEYIKSIARYVNEELMELNQAYPRMSRNKIISLSLMNFADELIKLQQQVDLLTEEVERVRKENQDTQYALERVHKLAQHYQNEYEKIAILKEEE